MGPGPLLVLALLVPLDGSGAASESPWVGFSTVFGGDGKGPSEIGVLDARTGGLLWRISLPDYVWVRAWGDLLLVTAARGEQRYACAAYDLRKGALRFRAEGRLWEVLDRGPRPLLAFEGEERLVAIDPATGLEAWTIPLRKGATLRLSPRRDRIVAHSGGTFTAYAADDGRRLWESTGFPSDWFSLSGGRLWIFPPGQRRPLQLGMDDGRLRETPEIPAGVLAFIEQKESIDLLLDRRLVRLRPADLSLVWALDLPEPAGSGWGDARTVLLDARQSNRVLVVDAAAGRLQSAVDFEPMGNGGGSSSLNHPRYCIKSQRPTGQPHTLRILDRSDGRIAWEGKVDDYEDGWRGDSLLVRSENRLRRIDLPSGREGWWAPIDGRWMETERRAGRILISTSRAIEALDAASGRPGWRLDFGREAKDVTLSTLPARQ